jgi:hypothetical protein
LSALVISDDIFRPSISEAICFHPILVKPLPCLVSLYPYFGRIEETQINVKPLHGKQHNLVPKSAISIL